MEPADDLIGTFDDKINAGPPFPPAQEEEKDIIRRFHEWWEEAYRFKVNVKKQMDHAYMSYRSILSEFSYTQRDVQRWGLAVFVPMTFQVISSIEAQLNGRPPQYRIGPANSPGDLEKSIFVNKFSVSEFKRAKAQRSITDATQQSLIFGTSFLQSIYRFDVRKKKFIKAVDDKTSKPSYEEREHTFYKGWALENLHPLTVYVPPVYEHDPQRWPYLIQREVVDVREEKAYYEAHPELCYRDNYKYIKPGGNIGDDMDVYNRHDILYRIPFYRYPGSKRDLINSLFPVPQTAGQLLRPYSCEKFRVYNQDTDEWMVIINDRVIEYHPNPMEDSKELPIVVMRDYQIAGWPWGLGEPDIIRWIQFEANSLHNLALDSTKYSASPIFGVNASMLDEEDEFEVYPGRIIHTKNIPNLTIDSAIKTLNTPEIKGSIFKMIGLNEEMMQKTTGVSGAVIGGAAPNEGSATEFNAIKQGTETRIFEKARRIEQENLVDIIQDQLEVMAQFYDEDMVVKISDQEFYKFKPGSKDDYSPMELLPGMEAPNPVSGEMQPGFKGVIFGEDLAQGFDVVVEGESTLPMNRAERRTEAMQLVKLFSESRRAPTAEELAADPHLPQKYPQGVPVGDVEKVVKNILLPTFSILDNPEEYLFNLNGQGPDRVRNPGRPPDAFAQPAAPGAPGAPVGTPASPEAAAMMTAAQPANLGNNQQENML